MSVNAIPIPLPPGCRLLVNTLVDTTTPACLAGTLVLAELADGTTVNASWEPEDGPTGSYVLTVYQGGGGERLARMTLSADPPARMAPLVAQFVTELARQYSARDQTRGQITRT